MTKTSRSLLLLVLLVSAACGEVSGDPGNGLNLIGSEPSAAAVAPTLQVTSFTAPSDSIAPGGTYTFTVTLDHVGCALPVAGRQLFIHFVSQSQPDWFAFSTFPVAAPPSETWPARVVITGNASIPADASGTYEVHIGINDGTSGGATQNVQLAYVAPISETFGEGPIGFRYRVGSLKVAGSDPGIPPSGSLAQAVIDSMQKADDGQLIIPGTRSANVQMGLGANGHETPSYWGASSFYENRGWWPRITPWWNVLPVVGNSAQHTRIEIGPGFTYIKTSDSGWQLISEGYNTWEGEYDYYATHSIAGDLDRVDGSRDGHDAFLPRNNVNSLHGGHPSARAETWKLTGLVTCMSTRLVVDRNTGIDDRAQARYIMWVGLDFYSDTPWPSGITWTPASGASRRVMITNEWQLVCMAPLDDPGRPDPENYRTSGQGVTFATADLLADPPPMPAIMEGL